MNRECDLSNVDVVTDLLARGHYTMVFQPIVEIKTGNVFGFEALLRGPEGTLLEDPAAQGFFIGRPFPADEWSEQIKKRDGRTIPLHSNETYVRASDDER